MKSAFTLIELAVVIVIIGIITGGVLGAQSLINSAKLNSTISKLREYNVALNAFKLEYDGMPGDLEEAEDYDLHLDGSGTNYLCPPYSGDGDKILDGYSASKLRFQGEIANYFMHLSNAELIKDNITRNPLNTCGASNLRYSGIDYPSAEIGTSILALTNLTDKKLYYILGGFSSSHIGNMDGNETSTSGAAENLLTAKEASRIEKKVDNNNPLSGTIRVITRVDGISNGAYETGFFTFDSTDSSTNCIYNSSYNVGYSEKSCTLSILAGKF